MDAVRKYIFNNKKLVNIIDNVYIFFIIFQIWQTPLHIAAKRGHVNLV